MSSITPPPPYLEPPPMNRDELLRRIAELGVNPFATLVAHTPWQTVADAESLHAKQKVRIRELIDTCREDFPRCLTFVAPAGWGKTHLLAWTRRLLDTREDAFFIFVPPYIAQSAEGDSFERHVMQAALDAIWVRSQQKRRHFEERIRAFLAGCYDRVVDSGAAGVKEVLRVGNFWTRSFRRWTFKIVSRDAQEQLAALQRVLQRRAFLECAFKEFIRLHPGEAAGVRPDWDTFVAACLLACGDTRQRWHADRWFHGDRIPPDVLQPFHLDERLEGANKIFNGLFTLNRLADATFCFAFDQVETTFNNLYHHPQYGQRYGGVFETVVTILCSIPGFAFLFMIQQANWQRFTAALPSLTHRMMEGNTNSDLLLGPLDDAAAVDLVQTRMNQWVWSALSVSPPEDQPCFPFGESEVYQLRRDSLNDLRTFLRFLQDRFDQLLPGGPSPNPPPPIRLTGIRPREVLTHEPTPLVITGEHLPSEVRVLFAGIPVEGPVTCSPGGRIEVTSPTTGLLGEVEVRVEDAGRPQNIGVARLLFRESLSRKPYWQHMDGQKFRARRNQLGLTPEAVAQKLAPQKPFSGQSVDQLKMAIVRLEGGRGQPPDALYEALAEIYERPLSSFLKQPGKGRA